MKKKDRYIYFIDEYDDFDWCIIDNETHQNYIYLEEITKILNIQSDTILQLKQQLAEKEKEIESCNHTIYMNMLNQEMLQLKVANLEQSQNKTAIEELEKVKEMLEPKYFDKEQINYLTKQIDQQIKSLKGE